MRQRWQAAAGRLPRLDELASKGSGFAAALAEAVREETAHAKGGAKPAHRRLLKLGFLGVRQLLSHRPAAAPTARTM